ncbi:MAG: GntR family transcriptional regulator [Bacilli bacterium]
MKRIREYIVDTNMKAGDALPTEKALEQLLRLSRTSIREALRSMEARGIIEAHQGQGRFLRGYNYDSFVDNVNYNLEVNTKRFKEVIDVRIALELHFLETITPQYSDTDIERIEENLAKLKTCINTEGDGEEERLTQIHKDFHLGLYTTTNNQLLMHLISMFANFQRTLVRRGEYPMMNTPDFYNLHAGLVDAIKLNEPFLVRSKLVEHFKDVLSWTRQQEK